MCTLPPSQAQKPHKQLGASSLPLISESLGFIISDNRIETHLELPQNPDIEEIQSRSLKDLKVLTKVLLLDTNYRIS